MWRTAAATPKGLEQLEKASFSLGQLVGAVKGHQLIDAWRVRLSLRQAVELARIEGILVTEAAIAGHLAQLPLPLRQDHGDLMKALRLAKALLATVGATWPRLPSIGGDEEATGVYSRSSLIAGLENERGPALMRVAQGLAASFGVYSRGSHGDVPAAFFEIGLTPSPFPLIAGGMRQASARDPLEFLGAFLEAVEREATKALALLRELQLTAEAIRLRMGVRKSNSRLPAAIEIVLRSPIVGAVMVAAELNCSTRGASQMLDELEKLGVVVEVSNRRAWKAYAIAEFGGLREDVVRPQRTFTFNRGASLPDVLDGSLVPGMPPAAPKPPHLDLPEGESVEDELDRVTINSKE